MYLQIIMTAHVRWPGKTGGAFGFALIFLLLFASRQKVDRRLQLNKVQTNCINAKVNGGLATLHHHRNKFI